MKRDCTIYVAKPRAVTAQLIFDFCFHVCKEQIGDQQLRKEHSEGPSALRCGRREHCENRIRVSPRCSGSRNINY